MEEEPGDRLKKLRIAKGYETAKDAAEAFGWKVVTYLAHENKGRGIRPEAARRYAKAFGSTPEYILYARNSDQPIINDVGSAKLVGTVSAGVFHEGQHFIDRGIEVPSVPRRDIPGDVQYALKVVGESVNKKIPDGSYAICAPFDKFPGGAEHGHLVHVIQEQGGLMEHTIKELRYGKDGAYLMPLSSDPRFQTPIHLNGDDDTTIRIAGVVIGAFSPL